MKTSYRTVNADTGEFFGMTTSSREEADAYTALLNASMKPEYRKFVTATITYEEAPNGR